MIDVELDDDMSLFCLGESPARAAVRTAIQIEEHRLKCRACSNRPCKVMTDIAGELICAHVILLLDDMDLA